MIEVDLKFIKPFRIYEPKINPKALPTGFQREIYLKRFFYLKNFRGG
jgi:hypothetical protein